MRSSIFAKSVLGFSAIALFGLSACITNNYAREEAAMRIAAPVWMVEREVAANGYAVTVRERMHERYEDATIYIEGDGMTWDTRRARSLDPTPANPVALHLSAHDLADNVAHIARPCQYSDMTDKEKACDPKVWTNARYSAEAVDTMNDVINEIKARYNLQDLHLVGYAGGGAIATILAAKRDDVASLRTVAGILDHEVFTNYHNVQPLSASLNPVDFADELAFIPQHHYIGGQDEIVVPAVLHSYLQALGNTNCVQYTFVQEAEHEAGFVEKWPDLMVDMPKCTGPKVEYNFTPTEPVFTPRTMPSKP